MAELPPADQETLLGSLSPYEAQALREAYQRSLQNGLDAGVGYASGYNLDKESLQADANGRLLVNLFAAGAANAPHGYIPGPAALLDSARRTGRLSPRADYVVGQLIGLAKDAEGNSRLDSESLAFAIDSTRASLEPEERPQIEELIDVFAAGATLGNQPLSEQYWQRVEAKLPKPPQQ